MHAEREPQISASEISASEISDEFQFLASDALRVGATAPLPRFERVSIPLETAAPPRQISGLRCDAGDPATLIALHGAGLNAHSFDPMVLSRARSAISLDLPGHGRSEWRDDGDYRPTSLAPDIAEVVRTLVATGAAEAHLTMLGHSLGGLTAALVADAQPAHIDHLVIVDITPGVMPQRDAGSISEFITGQRDYGSVDEIVDRALAFGIGHDRTALTRGVTLNTRRRPDGCLEWTHHLAHPDATRTSGPGSQPHAEIWAALARTAQRGTPITLVRASRGLVTQELADEWRERLPDSTIIELDGPHNLHEAAPNELAAVLAQAHSSPR